MSVLPVLISTHEPFVIFSLPCPAEEGSDRAALVGTWHPARVNPPHQPTKQIYKDKHKEEGKGKREKEDEGKGKQVDLFESTMRVFNP